MKKLISSLSLMMAGMLIAVSAFGQNVAFLYNKGSQNTGPKTIYVQVKCTDAAGNEKIVPDVVTLTAASNSTSSSILTVSNGSLTPTYCSQDDNLTIGISTVANSLAYDYSSCAKVVKFTSAATPQASFTIDYTNSNPAYQCF